MFKLLVITKYSNGLSGGAGVHQILIEFDTKEEAHAASLKLQDEVSSYTEVYQLF